MAFFDEIGRKISLAGEGAVNKGRAFADATRLSSNVSDEEKKIDNAYYQIGKLYVALHSGDYESEFESLISSIEVAQKRIEELKLQIQRIKGVTKCTKCGAEVPNNVAFCSACGAQMPRTEQLVDDNHTRCSGCGAVIDKNLRFCTSCGKPLAKIAVSSGKIDTAKKEENVVFKLCPLCGAQIDDGMKFCTTCGCTLEDEVRSAINHNEHKCSNCGVQVDPDSAFCEECGEPLNKERHTEDIFTEKKTMPQENVCTYCGAMVRSGLRFCTKCGKPISNQMSCESRDIYSSSDLERKAGVIAYDKKRCERCGSLVNKEEDFCTECGNPFIKVTAEESEFIASPDELGAVQYNAAKKCHMCGALADDDSAFCVECGARL